MCLIVLGWHYQELDEFFPKLHPEDLRYFDILAADFVSLSKHRRTCPWQYIKYVRLTREEYPQRKVSDLENQCWLSMLHFSYWIIGNVSPMSHNCKTSGKWKTLIMSLQCPRGHVWKIIMEPPQTVIFQAYPMDDQSYLDLRNVEARSTELFFTFRVWIGNR